MHVCYYIIIKALNVRGTVMLGMRGFFCFLVLCLVFVVALPAFGQNLFVETLGGQSADEGRSVVKVTNGGVVVTGYTSSYGAGITDLLLTKFNALGNHLWTKTLGRERSDEGFSVIEVSNGELVVTGYTTIEDARQMDLLLAKFDSWGNYKWSKALGGNSYDLGYSVINVSDGGIVVTGFTYSYGEGWADLLLTKFDSLGNHLWTKTLGGEQPDKGYSVINVSDGGIVVTGETSSSVEDTILSDLLLTKFDSLGNHLWTKTLGVTEKSCGGSSVIEVSDGGLVVTGYTYSYGADNADLLLTKFDASGDHLWTKTLGGEHSEEGNSVTEVSDGGIVVSGNTSSYGWKSGTYDLLLSKFDSSGTHLWTNTIGRTGDDCGKCVVVLADDTIVVTGYTYSFGAGNKDLLLAKFDPQGNSCMGHSVTPTVKNISPSVTHWSPTVKTWSPSIISGPEVNSHTPTIKTECQSPPASVELASFTATGHEDYVEIEWITAAEIDNAGFNIHRGINEEGDKSKLNEVMIPARGSELEGSIYSFTDYDVTDGITYYYWLEDVNIHGNSEMEGPIRVMAGSFDSGEMPIDFDLTQNYPNPFNPVTEIEYDLPVDCHVTLEIYSVLGRKVAVLVDEHQEAGSRTVRWDGKDENGAEATSGVYFCKLVAGSYKKVKKMTLLR
jgi:hypothetical protein